MRKKELFLKMNLQLLSEGGAAGGTGAGAGSEGTGVTQTAAGSDGEGSENPFSNIDFGKRGAATDINNTAGADDSQAPDRMAEFEKLINGEYKDLYQQKLKGDMGKRLKNSKAVENRLNALLPSVEVLAAKYGIDNLNTMEGINALRSAVENDNSLYQEEALEKGIPVETLRRQKGLEAENAALRRQQAQVHQDAIYNQWQSEAAALKAIYPQFDLEAEVNGDRNFMRLLKSGVPVKAAYEAIHIDQIMPAAMQYAARAAEERMSQSIASGSTRVVESESGNQGAVNLKKDLANLTPAERRALNNRVLKGEVISFT